MSRTNVKVFSRAACRRRLRAVLPMNKCRRRPCPLQTVAAVVASVVVPASSSASFCPQPSRLSSENASCVLMGSTTLLLICRIVAGETPRSPHRGPRAAIVSLPEHVSDFMNRYKAGFTNTRSRSGTALFPETGRDSRTAAEFDPGVPGFADGYFSHRDLPTPSGVP